MANCKIQVCRIGGLSGKNMCPACHSYYCPAHLTIHYHSQDHKHNAAIRDIQLDDNGKPLEV